MKRSAPQIGSLKIGTGQIAPAPAGHIACDAEPHVSQVGVLKISMSQIAGRETRVVAVVAIANVIRCSACGHKTARVHAARKVRISHPPQSRHCFRPAPTSRESGIVEPRETGTTMRLCAVGLGVTAVALMLLGVAVVVVSAMSMGPTDVVAPFLAGGVVAFLTGIVLSFGAATAWRVGIRRT